MVDEAPDIPPIRYTNRLAGDLELKWQQWWRDNGTFHAPNPSGPLGEEGDGGDVAARPKLYVLDMFPYPSGAGLHVGHPLGYIATDVYARFHRMAGRNVLHTMGFDAFGLPAEQYAIQTGQHPAITTEHNINNMRRQLERLGLGHDPRRSVATSDPGFYRWTQWIFLQVYNSWFDAQQGKARPISELAAEFESGARPLPDGREWAALDDVDKRAVLDEHRLVYLDDAVVNWCPALGTVLANEEVTADGRSERGNFLVFKRRLRQWKMRITAYAQRLLDDLEPLDWPESIKAMQRNWIGASKGARVRFAVEGGEHEIEVFTTRPDTLFGATFMVVAPENPLAEHLVTEAWPEGTPSQWTGGAATPAEALAAYQKQLHGVSDVDRMVATREKTGVFTGAYAVNPVNGERIPVFAADYVLAGYGTGSIMAVPAHSSTDFQFARVFGLPLVKVVEPTAEWHAEVAVAQGAGVDDWPDAFEGDGAACASENEGVSLNGLPTPEVKQRIIAWLEEAGHGHGTISYRLRDWLFSRQRYWGEPFPIVYDEHDMPRPLPESLLPVLLPDLDDYAPESRAEDDDSVPEPPLGRAKDWLWVELDLGDGPKRYRRETNTMPQWAGSCWYYLRYLDPENDQAMVAPDVERYWMGGGGIGGVDLYVGGVEHAVLHLLYARFWHKVLYDLGHVSTPEPFQRLFNQGYIQAYAFKDERGVYVDAEAVQETADGWVYEGKPVEREYGKMGKSLKNAVTPDEMYAEYGADTLRLYEMSMGPLDASRPWETRAVVGVHRLLQRVWRLIVDENDGAVRVSDDELALESRRQLHQTIDHVRRGMEQLRFNTSIARITELVTHLTGAYAGAPLPREAAESLVLMLAPLAPHIAEELWERMGREPSLVREPFPTADPAMLVSDRVELAVQVNGKVRATIEVAADASEDDMVAEARKNERVAAYLEGKAERRVIVVPGRMVSFVVG